MKILVAVDNTSASKAAITEALSKAEKINGKVIFVSCIEQTKQVTGDTITDTIDSAQQDSKRALQNAEKIADNYTVNTETTEIITENVVNGIVNATKSVTPDFVYVGHRQLGNSQQPVASVAKNLISQSPVPVTVVTKDNTNISETIKR